MSEYIFVAIIIAISAGVLYIKYVNAKEIKFLDYDYDFYFEPKNPITTPSEFTQEILAHFSKENQAVFIETESMEPKIRIDDEDYICKLGEPFRAWKTIALPINPFAGRFLGFKWVYIYKETK